MCAFGTKVQNLILFFGCAQSPGAPACSRILGTHIGENCPFFCNYTESLSERIFRMVLKRGCHSLILHFWLWLFCSEAKIICVNGSWKEKTADVLDFGIYLQMLHLDILYFVSTYHALKQHQQRFKNKFWCSSATKSGGAFKINLVVWSYCMFGVWLSSDN